MKRIIQILLVLTIFTQAGFGQKISDEAIVKTIKDIKAEAVKNPETLDIIKHLADEIGPRLTWSPGFNKAIDWSIKKLIELGLSNSHFEEWDPMGKSWELKKIVVNQTAPYFLNLVAAPKPWSPATKGTIKGKPVYFEAINEAEFEKYKGKLKGAIVLISNMVNPKINYNPIVTRVDDAAIKNFENVTVRTDEQIKKDKEKKEANEKATIENLSIINKKIAFCMKEGAAVVVEYGNRTYGTISSFGALLPKKPESVDEYIAGSSSPKAIKTMPQVVVSLEQYNSIVRSIKDNIELKLEINIETSEGKPLKGKSVFAEIPGTDLKNEVVMIGGHIDTQGPSIGATDNAVGVAVCMEAMRILKQLGVQPRRTIRIALWGGEEEGYLGSTPYIEKHFASSAATEKCYMYFNTDNGAGRFRGLTIEERKDLEPTIKKWFSQIDMKLITSLGKADNTDHVPFVNKGIPGFQFIQDALDYFRIYHTSMDRIERIPADDIRDNAIIMAALAYLASVE